MKKLCKVSDIPYNKPLRIKIDNSEFLVIRTNKGIYVTEPDCPHKGSSLEYGDVIDNKIKCFLHGFIFDLDNGKCIYKPQQYLSKWAESKDLKVYNIVIINGEVYVDE